MAMIEKQILLKALKEPGFAKDIFSELPGGAFSEKDEYKEIYLIIKRHYRTSNKSLDENTFLTLVEEKLLKQKMATEKIDTYFDVVHDLYNIEVDPQNTEVISEQIQRYVRKTLSADVLRKVIMGGKLEEEGVIEDLADQLKRIAVLDATGADTTLFDFFEDTDIKKDMYSNMKENRFSTGFRSIDENSGGGLARGEVGMVLASSGGGKSTWAVQQNNNYVKRGMNVLYIALEEKLDRMALKMEQNLLGVGSDLLFDGDDNLKEDVFEQTQQLYKEMPNLGRLFISKHNPQEVTIGMLEQVILDVSIRKGVKLDAVIIDYPDLMKNHHSEKMSESDAGGKLFEDIRALAGKYNYVCWVLSQLNRSGWGQDIRTAESIEGSKRKLNAVEIAFTLNQNNEEFQNGFLRIHIDKLRYNSGNGYDRMQYFRVVPKSYVIRDETPEETVEHKRLVGEESDGRPEKQSANDKANHFVENINKQL